MEKNIKIAAWILGAVTGLAVGSVENKIAPRNTVYPTAKRLGVLVAGVVAIEYLTTGFSLLLAKRFDVDPQILFDK